MSQKKCKLFRNKTKTKLKQKLAYCVYINTYLCRPKLILFEDVAYSASEKPCLAITPTTFSTTTVTNLGLRKRTEMTRAVGTGDRPRIF